MPREASGDTRPPEAFEIVFLRKGANFMISFSNSPLSSIDSLAMG